MFRLIQGFPPVALNPDGLSLEAALGWTDVVSEDDTVTFTNSSSAYHRYYAMQLAGGTKYTIVYSAHDSDAAFWLYYGPTGTVLTSVDSDSPSKPNGDGRIDNDSQNEKFCFTPSADGVYVLKAGAYSSGTGSFTVSVTPRPAEHSRLGFEIKPMTGLDRWGCAGRFDNLEDAGCAFNPYPEFSAPVNASSDSSGEWIISASSVLNSSNNPAWKAFAPPSSEHWHSTGGQPHWIMWQNAQRAVLIRRYKLTTRASGGAWPTDWELQGSDDGQSWTTLDLVAGAAVGDDVTIECNLTNRTAFHYHRIYVTRSTGSGSEYAAIGLIEAYSRSK